MSRIRPENECAYCGRRFQRGSTQCEGCGAPRPGGEYDDYEPEGYRGPTLYYYGNNWPKMIMPTSTWDAEEIMPTSTWDAEEDEE